MRQRVVSLSEGEREESDWGTITWLHSGSFSGSQELTVGQVVILPGRHNPPHIHPNCEEVLYLLDGELEHACGQEAPYRMRPGDSICIQRGMLHNAKCTSSVPARMLVSFSSAERKVQGER